MNEYHFYNTHPKIRLLAKYKTRTNSSCPVVFLLTTALHFEGGL